ncbi:MAG: 50S ribosomal protein L20 [Minisyncoccia bacterium]
MTRVKRGKIKVKKRKKLLKLTKGFKWGRKSKPKRAKEAILKALTYAYRDRKKKKSEFRKLWQIQIGNAAKERGLSYSKFIHLLKEKNIELDRKILAQIAINYPDIFSKIIEKVKS